MMNFCDGTPSCSPPSIIPIFPIVFFQGSTNGTWINEKRLVPQQRHLLRNGDIVSFGGTMKIPANGVLHKNPFVYYFDGMFVLSHFFSPTLSVLTQNSLRLLAPITLPHNLHQAGGVTLYRGVTPPPHNPCMSLLHTNHVFSLVLLRGLVVSSCRRCPESRSRTTF